MDEQRVRDESMASLLKQLHTDLAHVIDVEKALAKKELSIKAAELKSHGVKLGSAAAFGALGAMCLVAAAVLALALAVPAWLSALLIGAALIGAGALLAWKFKSDIEGFKALPQQAVTNVRQDVRAIKEATQ